jgi:feruloyl esterase
MQIEQSLLAPLLSVPAMLGSPISNNETDFGSKCASIASALSVENGIVYFSEFVAAGTNLSLPDNDPSCTTPSILVPVDICRIALSQGSKSTVIIVDDFVRDRNHAYGVHI